MFALFVKLNRAVQVAEVGKCERLASERGGALNQLGYFWQSAEERVVRVDMQMGKRCRHRAIILSPCALEPIRLLWHADAGLLGGKHGQNYLGLQRSLG